LPAPRRLVYFHYRKDSLTHARKHTHTPKLTGYELQRREREREGETGRERQRDGSKNESFQEPQKHNEPNARAARIVLAPRRRNRSFLISCHGEGKGESSAANSAPCQANTRRGEANEVYKMYVTVARLEHEVCAKLYFYYMPPPHFLSTPTLSTRPCSFFVPPYHTLSCPFSPVHLAQNAQGHLPKTSTSPKTNGYTWKNHRNEICKTAFSQKCNIFSQNDHKTKKITVLSS